MFVPAPDGLSVIGEPAIEESPPEPAATAGLCEPPAPPAPTVMVYEVPAVTARAVPVRNPPAPPPPTADTKVKPPTDERQT